MPQHFLLSRAAKTLTLAHAMRLSNEEAETAFMGIRWQDTNGKPVCPHCDCRIAYANPRPNGSLRWTCKACRRDFTLTSGTIFASRKMPVQTYLGAIAIFCNEVKGKAALALSRDLGTSHKTAFVLAHKIREAVASEMKNAIVGGPDTTIQIDGMYTGGYIRPANLKENRIDRRLAKSQNGKRRVVVIARDPKGRTISGVFKTEASSIRWLSSRVAKGSKIMADEASSWNDLRLGMK